MSAKVLVVILLLACIGLGAGWWYSYEQSKQETDENLAVIAQLSNQWMQVSTQLDEQRQVNLDLETNLLRRASQIARFSNDVERLTINLNQVEADAQSATKMAQAEVAKRDAKIAELESQRDNFEEQMKELGTSIDALEGQIAETERKLAAAEGDREFLLAELKRLQAEKAELERQFNDLDTLRQQVARLKEELTIAKRLEWLKRGFLGGSLKGAERLQNVFTPAEPEVPSTFKFEAELRTDGSGRIVPPQTNAPAPEDGPGGQ